MSVQSVQDKLDERYGRRRGGASRRGAIIGSAIVGTAIAALVTWTALAGAGASVDADATGFSIDDDGHHATVSFTVGGARGQDVACALEAQDTEHGVVGWRIVEYPANDELTRSFTESIPTTAEATVGLVASCWIP
ncbi:DUF4307 domain-containing protein [Microbacterium radiodurans]|uniref:DUF4307 domain-containing protein n=1 Tax=Microbacterium radiodurans TaxID=661398 RepID=A0A5J5IUI1_9MICO|nr:DUF4307 domain-containing protein [Microbacterium radiodurans]KAA9086622.1 DUF4307 domain-containing protein [Microbacterium radiodurans]